MTSDLAIEAFGALAQTTRMAIYRLLVSMGPEGITATEISKRTGVIPSTLSGHLGILKRSELLSATRKSREIYYAANLATMNDLIYFMLSDCCDGQVENCSEILKLLGETPSSSE